MKKWFHILCLTLLFQTAAAWAARTAVVDVEDLELMDGPGTRHQVVEKLKKGSKLTSSNLPVDGYFKVRTSSGKIGFVPGDTLIFSDAAEATSGTKKTTPGSSAVASPSAPPESRPSSTVGASKKSDKESEPVVRLRGFAGGTLFALDDVQNLFSQGGTPFKSLKNGFHYGGEINYILIPSLFVIIRVEQMEKTIYLKDTSTRFTFDLTVSGLPVTTGLGFRVLKSNQFSLNMGLMGGLGFSTQLKSTALSLPSPNQTVYADTPFAGVARLDAIWHVSRLFGVFAEAGYRFMRSQKMPQPTTVGNGSEIFQLDGSYSQIQVDLSGLYASGGFAVSF